MQAVQGKPISNLIKFNSKCVVLVGGTKMLQFSIMDWLRDEEINVIAMNGASASAADIIYMAPDLIIYDIGDNEMESDFLLKDLQNSQYKYSDICRMNFPILFLVSGEFHHKMAELSILSVIDYIDKPLKRSTFVNAVLKILRDSVDGKTAIKNVNDGLCLADGDKKFLDFFRQSLSVSGFKVATHQNLSDLAVDLKTSNYGCLVLDLYINGEVNTDIIELIHSLPRDIGVIGTVPLVDQEVLDTAYDAGLKTHFTKPIALIPFIQAIRGLMMSK